MNKVKAIAIISLLTIITPTFIYAQEQNTDRDVRNQKVAELTQQDSFEQAEKSALKAIEVAEASLGPDHPYVAIGINHLALLYSNQGEYAKAEQLYKRSLAIWEKALGPDHPYVTNCLNSLSNLYHAMGKDKEALEVDKRIERMGALEQ